MKTLHNATENRLPAADAAAPRAEAVSPATGHEKAAWIMMGAALLFTLVMKLVPALVAGLFVYGLIHALAARMTTKTLTHHRAKLVAVVLIGLVIVAAVAGLTVLLVLFAKGKLGSLPMLLDRMAAIIEGARERLGLGNWEPAAKEIKDTLANGLREHSQELQRLGGEAGRLLTHALIGIVIGALACFDMRRPDAPLSLALAERLRRLASAFEMVVFAQVKISALNTLLTALYLLVALPLFGIELPLRKTLVVVTFVVGLLPIVGNLVSNTVIVIIALGTSLPVAVSSLVFLVVIHKLEYFVNAHIMGSEIRAAAWEMLLAIVCFEAAFGVPGVVVAPFVYAYVKGELRDRGLI